MPHPKQGYHLADGTRVPGVTTILGNCKLGSIEGLLVWANKEGQDGRDHRETRDKAADAGTCAHDRIECDIRGWEFDRSQYTQEALDASEGAYKAYKEWAKQTQLQPAETETSLVSEEYRYGGTLDAMLVGGELSLGDWKTSSGVRPEYLIQLAAYQQLWNENYPDRPITGGLHLLRVSKQAESDDPVHFSHHFWSNADLAWEAFKHMRELYEIQKRLKKMV